MTETELKFLDKQIKESYAKKTKDILLLKHIRERIKRHKLCIKGLKDWKEGIILKNKMEKLK